MCVCIYIHIYKLREGERERGRGREREREREKREREQASFELCRFTSPKDPLNTTTTCAGRLPEIPENADISNDVFVETSPRNIRIIKIRWEI